MNEGELKTDVFNKRKFNDDTKLFATLWVLTLFLTVGLSLNLQAVLGNEGKMPVQGLIDNRDIHFSFTDPSEVNNYYLTDMMKVPLTNDRILFFSIGDVIMVLSIISMFSITLFYFRKERNK